MPVHDSPTRRALLAPLALLTGFGTLVLVGCDAPELPTALAPDGPAFAVQVNTNPVVNSLDDVVDASGCDETHCSLREAITFAVAGATITFDPTLTSGGAETITLTNGSLRIRENLTITGPGAASLAVSGNGTSGVFDVSPDVPGTPMNVSLSKLTITNGSANNAGGINNEGVMTLSDCVVSNSSAVYTGGGIYNRGTLTLTNTILSGNRAGTSGGGIYNQAYMLETSYVCPVLTLTSSTVSGNRAGTSGGGIHNDGTDAQNGCTVTVIGSTISDNTATFDGGGIYNYHGLLEVQQSTVSGNVAGQSGGGILSNILFGDGYYTEIRNSTVSGNTAETAAGGGIYNYNGVTRIVLSTITGNQAAFGGGVRSYNDEQTRTDVKGSVIWGNYAGTTADDVAADNTTTRFNSLGYNLVGAAGTDVDFTYEFNATGDQTNIPDAGLGALGSNGGPTQTHALLSGSPAIDAGTCLDHTSTAVSTDQRGVNRPQGTTCDIGAYESEDTGDLSDPEFTFNLSGLGTVTYGDGPFDLTAADYTSTLSSGTLYFSTSGSVGCSVTPGGTLTITGAATGDDRCRVTAYQASDGVTYRSAGPIEQSFAIGTAALTGTADDVTITYGQSPVFGVSYLGFLETDDETDLSGTLVFTFEGVSPTAYSSNTAPTDVGVYSIKPGGLSGYDYTITWAPGTFTINKAAGSVTINNIPDDPRVTDTFMPTYTKAGDGAPSTVTSTPTVCSVDGGVVTLIAEGTCTLKALITDGTNHLAVIEADAVPQTFTVGPETPTIPELMAEVEALGPNGSGSLNKGQVNSLLVTLQTAQKKLEKNQLNAVVNNLEEFIVEVQTFIDEEVLSPAEGQPLIDGANLIIVSLS